MLDKLYITPRQWLRILRWTFYAALFLLALLVQTVDLAEDSLRIDNNTRADDVDALRIQDAGRNQLQLVLLTAGYNGVTGIVAALAADNQIRLACENINKLTLAFVAPLSAENYLTWHRISSLSICNVLLSRDILIYVWIIPLKL